MGEAPRLAASGVDGARDRRFHSRAAHRHSRRTGRGALRGSAAVGHGGAGPASRVPELPLRGGAPHRPHGRGLSRRRARVDVSRGIDDRAAQRRLDCSLRHRRVRPVGGVGPAEQLHHHWRDRPHRLAGHHGRRRPGRSERANGRARCPALVSHDGNPGRYRADGIHGRLRAAHLSISPRRAPVGQRHAGARSRQRSRPAGRQDVRRRHLGSGRWLEGAPRRPPRAASRMDRDGLAAGGEIREPILAGPDLRTAQGDWTWFVPQGRRVGQVCRTPWSSGRRPGGGRDCLHPDQHQRVFAAPFLQEPPGALLPGGEQQQAAKAEPPDRLRSI